MDLYGPLLTDRQRDFVRMHFEEDLSFGEIAREHGISRQAVHDAVKHAEKSLEEYEAKLEFSSGKKRRPAGGAVEPQGNHPEAPKNLGPAAAAGLDPVIGLLEAIHEKLRRSGGVIYNADGITRDVGDVIDRLRQLKAE
ncbi:DNA-binding protein [bacterium]|nr:DNA-binding protein [bacterium]